MVFGEQMRNNRITVQVYAIFVWGILIVVVGVMARGIEQVRELSPNHCAIQPSDNLGDTIHSDRIYEHNR